MIKLVADEDFNNRILRGARRRQPQLDIVRVQDTLTREERDDDSKILEWAAAQHRVLITSGIGLLLPSTSLKRKRNE